MSFGKFRDDSKEGEKPGTVGAQSSSSSGSTATATVTVPSTTGRPDALLGKGTKVVGTLTFSGSAEIDCQVEGEVHSRDLLTILESAVVNGKIVGSEVIVRGTVNGDIIANKRLVLRRPARVVGNLTCNNLSIEEGVVFEGKCIMNANDASKAGGLSKGGTPEKTHAAA